MPTPVQWVEMLLPKVQQQGSSWQRFDRYYTGEHPIPYPNDKAKEAYRRLLRQGRANWCELVVRATWERLRLVGFQSRRGGDDPADRLWSLWLDSELDYYGPQLILEALIGGHGYLSVWPSSGALDGDVVIAPEVPGEVTVAYTNGMRRTAEAALKVWTDSDGVRRALVFGRNAVVEVNQSKGGKWATGTTYANPLGEVPIVELLAQPRLGQLGRSELASAIDIQDRINETLFNRLLAQQFASWRQRWATGLKVEIDPTTGHPVQPFDAQVDRLWIAEDGEVSFGEFSEHNLQNYISAVEADVQHLAAITRTPPHYLLGQSGAFPSGESLKSTETGLVAKVNAHAQTFGAAIVRAARLAARATGPDVDGRVRAVWADPESRIASEQMDALVKMKALGVPDEVIWSKLPDVTPDDIREWRTLAARQAINAATAAGTVPALRPPPRPALPAGDIDPTPPPPAPELR